MKDFNEYRTSFNDKRLKSAIKIFEMQLDGLEGEIVTVNGDYSEKVLVMNHINPLNESKEERYLATRVTSKIKRGDYLEFDNEYYNNGIFMVYSGMDNHKFNKQAKIRECNQTLNCKGQSKPIPCIVDNTAYGVKGEKDNGYFLEFDARLKILVQKNKETDRYYEGMRFIFNNKVAYKVTKVDDVVLNGIYILETTLTPLSPLDDLKNNIAYNERFDNEKPVESYQILGFNKIRVGQIEEYKIEPENLNVIYELDDDIHAQIFKQDNGTCKIKGLKSNGIVTLSAKIGQNIVSTKDIIVY